MSIDAIMTIIAWTVFVLVVFGFFWALPLEREATTFRKDNDER